MYTLLLMKVVSRLDEKLTLTIIVAARLCHNMPEGRMESVLQIINDNPIGCGGDHYY
jgi:hypothetical protein